MTPVSAARFSEGLTNPSDHPGRDGATAVGAGRPEIAPAGAIHLAAAGTSFTGASQPSRVKVVPRRTNHPSPTELAHAGDLPTGNSPAGVSRSHDTTGTRPLGAAVPVRSTS